jgi:hypothetical protein
MIGALSGKDWHKRECGLLTNLALIRGGRDDDGVWTLPLTWWAIGAWDLAAAVISRINGGGARVIKELIRSD